MQAEARPQIDEGKKGTAGEVQRIVCHSIKKEEGAFPLK